MNISTSCTVDAMTAMNEMSLRYGASMATSSNWIPNAQTELTNMTNITAPPMRVAVSSFDDTPRNGQMPRKYAKTKLLTRLALMKIVQRDSLAITPPPP
jgi:hypothetical protein